MNIWLALQALHAEHNAGCDAQESVHAMLAGYADMGYSRTDVAGILGVSRTALANALRHIDPQRRIAWPVVGPHPVRSAYFTRRVQWLSRADPPPLVAELLGVTPAVVRHALRGGA